MEKMQMFQKLTPSDQINIGIYENGMEYVFANNDIKNIAISGSYGAGKSSVIESYKKSHSEKKFIHISLAHFESGDVIAEKKEKTNEQMVAVLEGKIINQLVHQINPHDIVQTNFRVKNDIDKSLIKKVTFLAMIFFAITCFLCFKSTWNNMINGFKIDFLRKIFYFTTTTEIEMIAGAVALLILGFAVYELIALQKNVRLFKKLNIQGNEIEIFEEAKDSYFDRYLNEVLYLFEHAGADGIVFEDIDRYDTNLIFEKLREINYLLNRRNEMKICSGEQKVIRFFYLLRDDIFVSKDRTKFFDFILPIVPVVDASNAYNQFIKHFEQGNILQLFDEEFLQGLSIYVDDMRILKNIYNEFVVYYEQLKTSAAELNNNKLLAIIVYKNLFPRDFAELQQGRGYVHTLFAQKEHFSRDEINRLQDEIKQIEMQNEEMQEEFCDDLDELNAIYFCIDGRISVDGREETKFNSRKEFVHEILLSDNVRKYNSSYGRWDRISIDTEKEILEHNQDYLNRKKALVQKSNAGISKNNGKIEKIKRRIDRLKSAYLKNIISRDNANKIFSVTYVNEIGEEESFFEIKRSPYFALIKFLISNGYIDETYSDYMTYFYPNSITANDKNFLRSVTDKEAKPFDYALDNAALVISRIRMVDFEEEEVFNFDLLKELLSDTTLYKAQLQKFLYGLWNMEPVDFVSQYLEKNIFREKFVEVFNRFWSGACSWIIETEEFATKIQRQYVIDTICVSSDETIEANNVKDTITNFINKDADFLSYHSREDDKLQNGLKKLRVKFEVINFENANKDLLKFVYDNDLYCLNMNMIQKLLIYFYGIDNKDQSELDKRNLSLILGKEEEPLCIYVKENIDLYIELLLDAVENTTDTEETVIYVLNCEKITESYKIKYLSSSSINIKYLEEIDDKKLWNEVLAQNKLDKSIQNVYDYYFLSGEKMSNQLIAYINSFDNIILLETEQLDEKYGEKSKRNLFNDIIQNNAIQNSKYESMICSFGLSCTTFAIKGLSEEKINILINRNILLMNLDILTFIREKYPECCIAFILKNIHKYVSIIDEESFSTSELMILLEKNISDDLKLNLLRYEQYAISIEEKNYSTKVENYIVENLYCDEDFEYLLKWYPENREYMRRLIFKIAIENIEDILQSQYTIHVDLLERLIRSDEMELEDKKLLLSNQISMGLELTRVKQHFRELNLVDFQKLLDGKRPKIPATVVNEKLLRVLVSKKLISSYEEDKEDPEYFQTFGKVKRKEKEGIQ